MLLLLALLGCDPDCGDTSRIDGAYAVWSNVTDLDSQVEGQNLENYPYDEVFFNGWSEWELTYVPSQQSFKMSIDGQPFEGAYTADPDNCNAFELVVQGTYGAEDTAHTFLWRGDLTYLGVHLSGPFSYEDTWVSNSSGASGSIRVPNGQITASIADEGDTGF